MSSDITTEIVNILKETAKVKNIKDYEVKPDIEVQVGDGFLSQFYNGDVINKETEESFRVAIKKASMYDFQCEAIFSNEINFYSRVLPILMKLQSEVQLTEPFDNTPEYFASNLDVANRYIALEHLQPKGYVMLDKKLFMSPDHLKKIFQVYGKYHGLTFALRELNFEQYEQLKNGFKDVTSEFLTNEYSQKSLIKGLEMAVKNLDDTSKAREVAEIVFRNPLATAKKAFAYEGDYACLTHGDGWSNNMLFKYTKTGDLEDMKLIDFQLARETSPIHDLSYFFYSSASKPDFDQLVDYLKIYHSSLSAVLNAFGQNPDIILPFDTLIQEWKANALLGVIFAIFVMNLKLIDKSEFSDYLKEDSSNPEVMEKAVEFWDQLEAKVYASESFITRTRDILLHAFEFGVLTEDKGGDEDTEKVLKT